MQVHCHTEEISSFGPPFIRMFPSHCIPEAMEDLDIHFFAFAFVLVQVQFLFLRRRFGFLLIKPSFLHYNHIICFFKHSYVFEGTILVCSKTEHFMFAHCSTAYIFK
jgi:hypothetical protein